MKRFLTIFPPAENVHLIKDVGMLPFMMHKECNYDSTLACYKNGDYSYLDSEVRGLKLIFIRKIFNRPLLDGLIFLLFNFWKYDILQVYHVTERALIWSYFFKVASFGRGKTYLKLDARKDILDFKASKTVKFFMSAINLVSVETKSFATFLNEQNTFGRKVEYLPNGFYDGGKREEITPDVKERKIITVGRIGAPEKANHILCKAFELFSKSDEHWKMEVVGPVEEDFKSFITTYFEESPHLMSRVTFTGAVNDRTALESYYRSAKVFVLCSRFEGFPMVFLEATRFGCYIISTPVPSVFDVIDKDKYGVTFPTDDYEKLANILLDVSGRETQLGELVKDIQDHTYENFYWPEICKNTHKLLMKL